MRHTLISTCGLLLGAAALVAGTATPMLRASAPAAAEPTGLTWSDEFNGASGAPPDPAKWRQETGGSGWGNGELQYYTTSTRNASQNGKGALIITARKEDRGYTCHYGPCQYTSARLITADRFSQKYGRFTARIKIPGGQGLWPAFWMLSDNLWTQGWPGSGEIDVMENIGREPGIIWGSLHGPGYSGANALHASYTLAGGKAFSSAYHVFTVDWAPDSITWYVDGVAYQRRTPADVGSNPWPFHDPFFLLLNVAVGGYWPGAPDSSTTFPKQMLVDYVRVYGWNETPPPPPALTPYEIHGYAGKCLDASGPRTGTLTLLQLWDCNGATTQQWTFPGDGTIRAQGACLDLANGATGNGTRVGVAPCTGGSTQQFVLNAAADLVSTRADRCVDVADWNSANGAALQIWDCAGTANQKWWRSTR